MKKTRVIKTDKELKIFSDPYRLKIISTYQEQRKPLTVKAAADLMGEVPAKVHYHVKKLLSIDILELDHVEVINGIQAKYYKLKTDSFTIDYPRVGENIENKIDSSIGLLDSIIEDFKKDLRETADKMKNDSKNDNTFNNIGVVSKDDIYLSEEDYKIVHEKMMDIFQHYRDKSEGKKKYTLLAGIVEKK